MSVDTIQKLIVVDSEFVAASLIADDEALPTTTRVGAIMQGMDAAGGSNVDVARLAKVHDVDSGAGTEYAIGISKRVAASGGSIAETYGAGAVAAGTPRITLASDDPAVASLAILDNIVSGNEAQVDIVAPLPAGTNNIGDVDVVSSALPTGAATAALQTQPGVDIGDVTVNNGAGASAVNIQDGGNSITIDGTVAATQSGTWTEANSAAIAASLAVVDDWDESDRAKVNIIVGQAGITAGAGAVAANTPRVTHASDDPVTTSVQLIDDAIVTDNAAFTDTTTKLMMAGHIFDETAGTALTENDAAASRVDAKRAQVMVIEDTTSRGSTVRATVVADLADYNNGVALTANGLVVMAGLAQRWSPEHPVTPGGTGNVYSQNMSDEGNVFVDLASIRGVATSVGSGVNGSGVQRVTLPTDQATSAFTGTSNRSDTYTTTANGTAVNVTANPVKYYSLQVIQTGTVTSWDVRLEVSLDGGTTWGTLITHTNADGSGAVKTVAATPGLRFRSRCAGIVLGAGTNVIAYIIGIN